MINVKQIFRSIGFAFQGLLYVIKTQNNAHFHLLATILVILIGFWLKLGRFEWCMLVIAIGLVWTAECFNTSLEKIFDLIHPESHPLVKIGKDTSAAAVLITAFISIFLGIIALAPSLLQKFHLLFTK